MICIFCKGEVPQPPDGNAACSVCAAVFIPFDDIGWFRLPVILYMPSYEEDTEDRGSS